MKLLAMEEKKVASLIFFLKNKGQSVQEFMYK